MNPFIRCTAFSFLIMGLAWITPCAHAAVLASYIDGTDADAAALVNLTTPSGYTVSNLGLTNLGTGTSITVTAVGTQATPGGTEWLYLFRSMTNDSTPDNTNTNIIDFNVQANSGNAFDLASLTFDAAVAISGTSTGFGFFYQLYASTDNVTYSQVGGVGASPVLGNQGSSGNYISPVVPQSIDLSGLADAQNYYFRLYLGDNATTGTKAGLIQNMNLNGSIVAVPEPSAALLGGMGALLLLRRRR